MHVGSMSCSRSQGKTPGLGSVTADACGYRHREHPTPLQEGHNPLPQALLCSWMQFTAQPVQSRCSVTEVAANRCGGWEGTVGTGTRPSQAVSLVPVPRCSEPAVTTAKQLLVRQGLLFLHRSIACSIAAVCFGRQGPAVVPSK